MIELDDLKRLLPLALGEITRIATDAVIPELAAEGTKFEAGSTLLIKTTVPPADGRPGLFVSVCVREPNPVDVAETEAHAPSVQ